MKILIVAPENDNHTAPLKWALQRAGFGVACWAGVGWSEKRQAAISLSNGNRVQLGEHILEPGDVVWVRRPDPPKLNPRAAPEDTKFAATEYRWFFHSVMYLFETLPVRCINKYSASRLINNKSVQLLLARNCGMNVPATLMTNSPSAVRNYFRESASRMICKAFYPHIWQKQTKDAVAVTETFELTESMLPEDEVLTYAPAIYQELVVKQFDVRMVLLGSAVYSYSVHNPTGAIDWRQDAGQGLVQIQPIDTPPEVERGVLAFAARSQIAYGSFDFAVDNSGQWWFLEVNEGGQFLWLDDFNPSLHVQEKFLAFLTSPEGSSKEILEAKQSLFPSWREYLDSPAKDAQAPEEADPEAAFVSIEA
jgi:glutathione synthase/RimK-type ligase-like ATP-grasp enzyme